VQGSPGQGEWLVAGLGSACSTRSGDSAQVHAVKLYDDSGRSVGVGACLVRIGSQFPSHLSSGVTGKAVQDSGAVVLSDNKLACQP
jgi:hypothetical protein